ncbi:MULTISPECIES: hypothetical protein [Bradyrhizobium]|jgi:hypothetical protein|uniref:hypothetical protein n=1 Tax=Bradyrhizobium TaxID=374 RepID=UPI000231C371|nr:hypothetical protein [Bradyrhizobium japonicum]AJA59140.1 hypothetical protein RN69_00855 [Bradyrhizobium japonicum]KMJ96339.1 hypothetical protein CF64_27675 [Bradyrhizobium japonicum]MBR0765528.1 hypothetical protein [Bradyrhizobium japonicum]MCS3536235.1 hypothetical protein [Bradyrhizobium japonicum]MCS3987664.1 hypothetical protein [Bradyrhizobium japonicum]
MCVALLTYADLSTRLGISREAARALARRRRLPRSRSDDGKALVSVDLTELRYTPRPRRARRADHIDASLAKVEASEPFPLRRNRNGTLDSYFEAFSLPEPVSTSPESALEIETLKAEVARLEAVAAAYRAVFDREHERADRLAVELTQAAAEATAANAWAARLEDEVADLRAGRRDDGAVAGAARRLGHLAASIVQADRAARR